jgi:hypothetical protein
MLIVDVGTGSSPRRRIRLLSEHGLSDDDIATLLRHRSKAARHWGLSGPG